MPPTPRTRDCAYLVDTVCTHPACRIKGGHPSKGFCGLCRLYTRWRGLGDLVHWCIGWLPSRKVKEMQLPVTQGGCGGCKARQAALNAAVPFGKVEDKVPHCGSCGKPKDSAQVP